MINIPEKIFYPLFSLQHRGQESAGLSYQRENKLITYKDVGMVSNVLAHYLHEEHPSRVGIGHCRYSTKGGNRLENAQPMSISCNKGEIAIAHNGTISNAHLLREKLFSEGSIFQSTSDTELILHMIARSQQADFMSALIETINQLEGAFSLLLLYTNREGQKILIALRDRQGFRPLVFGESEEMFLFASETCALDILKIPFQQEIAPGEMVVIEDNMMRSIKWAESPSPSHCIFELIYFARPDSTIFNYSVHKTREKMGELLAEIDPVKADLVMAVPDSGNSAALGYAHKSGIPFEIGLTRNHYTGRTFILPTNTQREFGVRIKLNPISRMIKGKKIILLDDSLVRGTTSRIIVGLLRQAGAQEIHLRLSSPQIRFPCFFGIDIPTRSELISHRMSPQEIAAFIGADSVLFLPIEILRKSVGNPHDFCYACFSGEYPVSVDEILFDESNQEK